MSRLRLAAACALLKLAQEPCYHEIITLEQYQLCSLVINVRTSPPSLMAQTFCVSSDALTVVFLSLLQDECYQVRQCFSQKLHRGLCRLRLPLEYMAVFALCAKDPVKERRAHARQCLVKNVNIRREYLKQHAALSGKEIDFYETELVRMELLTVHVWFLPVQLHKLCCDEVMIFTMCANRQAALSAAGVRGALRHPPSGTRPRLHQSVRYRAAQRHQRVSSELELYSLIRNKQTDLEITCAICQSGILPFFLLS